MAEVFLVCVQLREIIWHDVAIVYAANFRLFLREIEVGESNPTQIEEHWNWFQQKAAEPQLSWCFFANPGRKHTRIIQTPVFEKMS